MRQGAKGSDKIATSYCGQLQTQLPAVLSGHPDGFEDVAVDVEVAASHGGRPGAAGGRPSGQVGYCGAVRLCGHPVRRMHLSVLSGHAVMMAICTDGNTDAAPAENTDACLAGPPILLLWCFVVRWQKGCGRWRTNWKLQTMTGNRQLGRRKTVAF